MFTVNSPLIFSSLKFREVTNPIPLPIKFFSDTEKPTVPPSFPTPADANISPVGFSCTVIFIFFCWEFSIDTTSSFISSNILKAFKLLIDFACNNLLNGSPSSTSSWFLITFSSVILFPKIFTLFTKNLSLSITANFKFKLFSPTSSISIVASIKSYSLATDILSISFITLLILLNEYFAFFSFSIDFWTSLKSLGL